ncbi:nitroreductase/quinone reductase family protein [Actinomadura adrarensis]|uniref:Nitroreductase/quinone reductase family protein n=1 Tax=Actinomadura adrarensis TaxID=1819600 RepID=A0ABW3CK21_9ACTN
MSTAKLERTHRLDRWMYRGGRPNRLARIINRVTARVFATGLKDHLVTLEVKGRRTGRVISFPLVMADHEGERCLVAMLGPDTNWVQNVHATGGKAVLRHGRRETVHLTEVASTDRAPILRRYLTLSPGARSHIPIPPDAPLGEFEQLATEYPVFRITPANG